MALARALGLLAAAGCVFALAGCGGSSSATSTASTTSATTTAGAATPLLLGPRTAAERRMEAIVRSWSARLNAGDYAGIAQLFALPALIVQAPYTYQMPTRHLIALWHSGLPCGGSIVSILYKGRFATAVFRLTNRRGQRRCDQPGGLAAARFEIVGGKIVSWVQVPVPKSQSHPAPIA